MQISQAKLRKMRSGQTVWRVLAHIDAHGLTVGVQPVHFTGKKVRKPIGVGSSWRPVQFNWAAYNRLYEQGGNYRWLTNHYKFANDAFGHGAFTSRNSAERFAQEIRDGLHPDLIMRLRDNFEMDQYLTYDYGHPEED
jgi:hypothetical protein